MRDRGRLRAVNAVVSALMMLLFLVHGVGNALQLLGVGSALSQALSWTLVGLCVVHVAIGVVLTADTLRTQREAGASYPTRNTRFWAVRVSGAALALLILAHVLIFLKPTGMALRLPPFLEPQLALSVLLVATLAVHVLANMEPLMVSLGVGPSRERAGDLVFVLAVLLLVMAAGFVVYYLRWSLI